MKPGIWFSIGCMTGYELIYDIQPDFTQGSRHGITHASEVGCIDAPESIPAGGMRAANSSLGQVQVQAVRP